MVENESPALKGLLGDISYLLKTAHMKRLISIMTKANGDAAAKGLDALLHSQAFKVMYYSKVKSITKYKGSFEQFYDKFLDKFSKTKQGVEVL